MSETGREVDTGALTGVLFQILMDTKHLQKEINALTGKLDRTFAVTDEMVFKVTFSVHFCCHRTFWAESLIKVCFLFWAPGCQEGRVCA